MEGRNSLRPPGEPVSTRAQCIAPLLAAFLSCLYTTLVEWVALFFRLTVLQVIFTRERVKEQRLWTPSKQVFQQSLVSRRSSGIGTSSSVRSAHVASVR